MKEGFNVVAPLEIAVDHESDAEGDQDGAEQESKSDAEQKAHGVLALGSWNRRGKAPDGFFLASQNRANDVDIGGQPEFNLVARLPEQINARANHERANDSQKLRHGYLPRPAVRDRKRGDAARAL